MFPDNNGAIANTAIVVGLMRDVVFLVLLTVALIALLVILAKIRQLLNTVQETANRVKETSESVQEAVNTISEQVVEPAASNAGVMRGIGGVFGFLTGMGRRRKRRK